MEDFSAWYTYIHVPFYTRLDVSLYMYTYTWLHQVGGSRDNIHVYIHDFSPRVFRFRFWWIPRTRTAQIWHGAEDVWLQASTTSKRSTHCEKNGKQRASMGVPHIHFKNTLIHFVCVCVSSNTYLCNACMYMHISNLSSLFICTCFMTCILSLF